MTRFDLHKSSLEIALRLWLRWGSVWHACMHMMTIDLITGRTFILHLSLAAQMWILTPRYYAVWLASMPTLTWVLLGCSISCIALSWHDLVLTILDLTNMTCSNWSSSLRTWNRPKTATTATMFSMIWLPELKTLKPFHFSYTCWYRIWFDLHGWWLRQKDDIDSNSALFPTTFHATALTGQLFASILWKLGGSALIGFM